MATHSVCSLPRLRPNSGLRRDCRRAEDWDARSAARYSRHQLQPFPAWPDGHPGAGGPWRRCDCGREPRRRLAAALEQRRHLARRSGDGAYVHQPQQAQRRPRSEIAQGPGDRIQAHRRRRRGGREFPPGGDGKAWLRLRSLASAQAFLDLCLGVGLRPRGSLHTAARSGSAGAGAIRAHGYYRPRRNRAATGRGIRGRPPRRRAVRHGNSGRAAAARAHRQGLPGRCEPHAGRA